MLFDWCSLFGLDPELWGGNGGKKIYSEMSKCRLVSV